MVVLAGRVRVEAEAWLLRFGAPCILGEEAQDVMIGTRTGVRRGSLGSSGFRPGSGVHGVICSTQLAKEVLLRGHDSSGVDCVWLPCKWLRSGVASNMKHQLQPPPALPCCPPPAPRSLSILPATASPCPALLPAPRSRATKHTICYSPPLTFPAARPLPQDLQAAAPWLGG